MFSVNQVYHQRIIDEEKDGWSGRYLLNQLTAIVHLRNTSHEYLHLKFMITSLSNRVCIESNPVRILLGCCY